MGSIRWSALLVLLFLLAFTGGAISEESGFAKEFIKAFDANDEQRMTLLVEMKKDSMPVEIKALIDAGRVRINSKRVVIAGWEREEADSVEVRALLRQPERTSWGFQA